MFVLEGEVCRICEDGIDNGDYGGEGEVEVGDVEESF